MQVSKTQCIVNFYAMTWKGHSAINWSNDLRILYCWHSFAWRSFKKYSSALRVFARKEMGTQGVHIDTRLNKIPWVRRIKMFINHIAVWLSCVKRAGIQQCWYLHHCYYHNHKIYVRIAEGYKTTKIKILICNAPSDFFLKEKRAQDAQSCHFYSGLARYGSYK